MKRIDTDAINIAKGLRDQKFNWIQIADQLTEIGYVSKTGRRIKPATINLAVINSPDGDRYRSNKTGKRRSRTRRGEIGRAHV